MALAWALPSSGQAVTVQIRDGVTRGDELHALGRAGDALEALRGVLAADSMRWDALWRVARESVSLGMLAQGGDDARAWFTQAVAFGRRAVSTAPDSVDGYQWLAIALGRLALVEPPRARVRLSQEVRTTALAALALDSTAAGAHDVLGQWHAEILRLGALTRFTAERLLGGNTFREASWEAAEHHLRRAVELEPQEPIHRLALAKVLLDIDRPDVARAELQHLLALPLRAPTDSLTRVEGRALLLRLGR